ncbi:exopolyphosphatase/guanosine-5'-triphosphate,3'-diphosphate pyrophosphatase [Tamaricihabitans halophyticus]|uniref:Exopolyphosphatase/guanosine-5'-triphosphate, 3'-diphosphate pyrophosphatase n=1 Tax=Tamaricihabitans halophyticus TaxID=1262583 RepID=A0A4R2R3X2_9PSEU|nr:Ppx/GppA phosphatase family protein [Tamaricihabitans halophyticus]TCP56348.1 exopolyphosphatase/guanosine-5'-triphosphate,3'-diphosphate pyrophosphatase [Tamaricihabitans halophyticus]
MARVAAIDCGTNSIRLLVADVTEREDGTSWLRDVHREMRVVRLGQGVDATGRLAPEAIERTRAALADYTNVLRRKGVQRARMVATSATRDASNREDFFAMTAELLGKEAEVISGDTEAELSFVGAVGDLDPAEGPFVVADIGGGSTELVLGTSSQAGAEVTAARSVDVGCVRITERCLSDDPPTSAQVAEAERFASEKLAEAFETVPVQGAKTFVGVAGTVTTLSAVAMRLDAYDAERIHLSRLSLDGIRETTDRLLGMTHDERAAINTIHPGRVDVIAGGALVVRVLAEQLADRAGITELRVSEHDILDGIALSLV